MFFLIQNVYCDIQSSTSGCTDLDSHSHQSLSMASRLFAYMNRLAPTQKTTRKPAEPPQNITFFGVTFYVNPEPYEILKIYMENGATFNVQTSPSGDMIAIPEKNTNNRKKRYVFPLKSETNDREKRFARPIMEAVKKGAAAGVGVTLVLKYNQFKDFVSSYIDVIPIPIPMLLFFPNGNATTAATTTTTTKMPKTERKVPKFIEP